MKKLIAILIIALAAIGCGSDAQGSSSDARGVSLNDDSKERSRSELEELDPEMAAFQLTLATELGISGTDEDYKEMADLACEALDAADYDQETAALFIAIMVDNGDLTYSEGEMTAGILGAADGSGVCR